MASLTIALTAFIIGLSGAAMPGPMLTATIDHSARRGFRAGPAITLGHGLLEAALAVAILLGLKPFLTRPELIRAIGFIGGLFMAYMAFGMMARAWREGLPDLVKGDSDGSHRTVFAGAFFSLSNPYWIVWWATIGAAYLIIASRSGTIGIVAFLIGHISADLAWYSLVSFAVSAGRKVLNDTVYRVLIGVCSVFLFALAASFIGGFKLF